MLYLNCTTITSVDLAHNGISRAKDWVSVDCGTISITISRDLGNPSFGTKSVMLRFNFLLNNQTSLANHCLSIKTLLWEIWGSKPGSALLSGKLSLLLMTEKFVS